MMLATALLDSIAESVPIAIVRYPAELVGCPSCVIPLVYVGTLAAKIIIIVVYIYIYIYINKEVQTYRT